MSNIIWRKRFRVLLLPLALAALGWAVYLLWDAWPQLRLNLPRLQVRWLLLPLVGTMVAGYLGFEAFRTLFNQMRPAAFHRAELAHLYFVGQLMKHLPGRIWGVAYQSSAGDRASLSEWIGVTAVYMLLSTVFALWVAATVLGMMIGWHWGLLVFVAGSILYVVAWSPRLMLPLLQLMHNTAIRSLSRLSAALQPFAKAGTRFKMLFWWWLLLSWLVYLLAWAGYGMAWPGLRATDGMWLCALYTVAWFAGYVSLVSPSGAGIRELVFVLLARDFPPDAVAGMAVLGRVVLLLVDVLLGAIFISFRTANK